MSRRPLSRRAFLRGAGGVALGLPFLEAMLGSDRAAAATGPKRLVVFYTPNGFPDETWQPTMSAGKLVMSPLLSPLSAHADRILTVSNVTNGAGLYSGEVLDLGDGHTTGMSTMLTGAPLRPGSFPCGGGCSGGVDYPGLPSVDQVVAAEIGAGTKLASLELGVATGGGGSAHTRMIFNTSGQALPPENDPAAAFDRVFGDVKPGGGEDPAFAKLRAERKTILDAVIDDTAALEARLGKADQQRLDAYLTNLRELEKRIAEGTGPAVGCELPALGAGVDVPAMTKNHLDLVAHALQCDLTRVASFQFTYAASYQTEYTWLGIPGDPHDISHNLSRIDDLTAMGNWQAEQLAYLLDKLAAMEDATGPILDRTVVLWCSEVGEGNSHRKTDNRFLIAGSGGGYFETGRHVTMPSVAQSWGNFSNDLMISICHAMDVPVTSFGDPTFSTGKPLPGLAA